MVLKKVGATAKPELKISALGPKQNQGGLAITARGLGGRKKRKGGKQKEADPTSCTKHPGLESLFAGPGDPTGQVEAKPGPSDPTRPESYLPPPPRGARVGG